MNIPVIGEGLICSLALRAFDMMIGSLEGGEGWHHFAK